jgi:hypothetical protein
MPVPQQSGQSSRVSINLLSPPKKAVSPEPPQPGQGVIFLDNCFWSVMAILGG